MSKDTETMNGELSYLAFKVLHAVYHERDFRVRVNDPTINFVRRTLAKLVGEEKLTNPDLDECPACQAGFDYNDEQPIDADRDHYISSAETRRKT